MPRILKTEKGSAIKRSRYGVGKDMGGTLYMHRSYESKLPNQRALEHAKTVLAEQHPGFHYNVVKMDKTGRTSFFNSPDFDTAHEPVAGPFVTVDGHESKASKTNKLWHHKWTFVDDDYRGFDVDDSFDRSRRWLKIPNINFNHIGDPKIWHEQYVPKIPAR